MDELEVEEANLSDDDPDVIAGMKRLAELRKSEAEVEDFVQRRRQS